MNKTLLPLIAFLLTLFASLVSQAETFLEKFFPDLSIGMSTTELLSVRQNAVAYPYQVAESVSALAELVQTNSSVTSYAYYFKTNSLKGFVRSSECLSNEVVVPSLSFAQDVRIALSNDFTKISSESVQRLGQSNSTTNISVELWTETNSINKVIFLFESNEVRVIYYDPSEFTITNFFILSE